MVIIILVSFIEIISQSSNNNLQAKSAFIAICSAYLYRSFVHDIVLLLHALSTINSYTPSTMVFSVFAIYSEMTPSHVGIHHC